MGRLRPWITYANVASTLALVLALGGGAVYAASQIGAKQIRKGAVRSRQIGNKQVRRQDIAGGAINSRKVSNDTLKGKDIQESTLGLVPQAQDARTVNGVGVRLVRLSQPDPSAAAQVLVQGGLTVLLSCSGDADMTVRGSASGDTGAVFDSESGTTQEFDPGSPQSVPTLDTTSGFATVRRIDGTVTRLDFELSRRDNGFGTQDDCFLHGFLFSGS
jgi:hypothetical protein